jgi:hypothetical protein
MLDIHDGNPKRLFLPKGIVDKLPFSSLKMNEIKLLFKAPTNSSLEKISIVCLKDCGESSPSDEVKLCVGSIENMLEFATAVLSHNVCKHYNLTMLGVSNPTHIQFIVFDILLAISTKKIQNVELKRQVVNMGKELLYFNSFLLFILKNIVVIILLL